MLAKWLNALISKDRMMCDDNFKTEVGANPESTVAVTRNFRVIPDCVGRVNDLPLDIPPSKLENEDFVMHKKVNMFMLSVSLFVAALTVGGSVAAASGTSTSSKSAGPQIPKAGGLVHLTSYSDSDGPKSTTVLTGAIGDYGMAVRTYANGTVVQQYNRLDVEVTHGSFQLEIAGLERSLVSAFGPFPTDLKSCSGIVIVHATTPIVSGSGTGAYKGISGSFKMTVTINEVDSWPKCSRTGQSLLTQSAFITASGNVSLH